MSDRELSPLGWAVEPIRRYADFSGRSRRREYWWFFLLQMLLHIIFVAGIIAFVGEFAASDLAADSQPLSTVSVVVLCIVWVVVVLGLIVPNVAVVVRRCHDTDIPAWVGVLCYVGMFLFSFIGIAIMVMMAIEGKAMANAHGPDPKGRDIDTIFS